MTWLTNLLAFRRLFVNGSEHSPRRDDLELIGPGVAATDEDERTKVDLTPPFIRYLAQGTSLAFGAKLALSDPVGTPGFSLASDEVELPFAGIYEFSLSGSATSDDTANPKQIAIALQIAGTPVMSGGGWRFSANTSHDVLCTVVGAFEITDPATQKVSVVADATNGLTGAAHLIIRQRTITLP